MRRSVTYVTGIGLVEGTPENHTARTVPVPAFVARLLATELEDRGGDELAFPPPRGEYLAIENVRHPFAKAVAAVGCPGVRLHDLRQTCASLAISPGANVKGGATATWAQDGVGRAGSNPRPTDYESLFGTFGDQQKRLADSPHTAC